MFAVIRMTLSIRRAVNYHEAKINKGVASCLGSANYTTDACKMSRAQKLDRLLKQAALRPAVKRSCVHISLNFHPAERLSDERMMKIAATYMSRLGLGRQPWLAYRHYDAGHPHMHIVSVAIDEAGERVPVYQIRKLQAKRARVETEADFRLKPRRTAGIPALPSGRPRRLRYGEASSRAAIAGILHEVVNGYNYTDLAGFNAVLACYHLVASRGGEKSRIRQGGGLIYQILSEGGKKTGIPVKASVLPGKPTFALLQTKFRENVVNRGYGRQAIKNTVHILTGTADSLEMLRKDLGMEGISMVLTENEKTGAMELVYVDHVRRVAVREGELGTGCCIGEINRSIKARTSPGSQADFGGSGGNETASAPAERGKKAVKISLPVWRKKGCEEPELQCREKTGRHL